MLQTYLEQRDGTDCFIRNYSMFIPDKGVVIQTSTYSDLDKVNVSTWDNPDSSLPEPVRAWFGCGKIKVMVHSLRKIDQPKTHWLEERVKLL